jgi:amidohydrolase
MLVESGVLANVRAVVATHVHPGIPWGSVGADPGAVNAAADSLVFRIIGQPGHGAYPHLGRDPILAMAEVIVGLHSLVGRRIDPLHPAVVNVGAVHAGEAANVIPPHADARATLRTLDDRDRLTLREAARSLIEATCRAHDCPVEIAIEAGEPLLANDPEITGLVRDLLPRAGLALAAPWRSCGSDDFSFFSAVAPILMTFVGIEGAEDFRPRPLHHPEFLPPEAAVSAVARTLAVSYLGAAEAG